MKTGKSGKTYAVVAVKKKKICGTDVFEDPKEQETSEDVGMTLKFVIGSVGGLDMSSIGHRTNSRTMDITRTISASILDNLPSSLKNYVSHSTEVPYNFNLHDGSTLSLRMNRRQTTGECYPVLSGQLSWSKFVEAFGSMDPSMAVLKDMDVEYVKKLFAKHGVAMTRLMLADLFIADWTAWAWANGAMGPGYVLLNRNHIGWDPKSEHCARRGKWPDGLRDGDFKVTKEVDEWKGVISNTIEFHWGGSRGWITLGTLKIQRNRNSIQFGFKMANLMMILGLAARRSGRDSSMFDCSPVRSREKERA